MASGSAIRASHRYRIVLSDKWLQTRLHHNNLFRMGRPRRAAAGGVVYHVLNRANRRARIFHKPRDYEAFLRVLAEGLERLPCRLLALCLMPNHWHLVLCPHADGDLSKFLAWVTNTHVKRYRQHYHDKVGGHLYQGRFKSFPVQDDAHLLTVLRYVEANPLRAHLAQSADEWPWCSYALRGGPWAAPLLSEWPLPLPADWGARVESRWREQDLAAVRTSLDRGRPFGEAAWVLETARRLGLEVSLRPPGRPKSTDLARDDEEKHPLAAVASGIRAKQPAPALQSHSP
jgi:putative transposase